MDPAGIASKVDDLRPVVVFRDFHPPQKKESGNAGRPARQA